MPAVDITAHDIETAIRQGLAQLNLLRAEVRIEVLDEGSRGVLGIGARPARVRLTPYEEIESAQAAEAPSPQPSPATARAPSAPAVTPPAAPAPPITVHPEPPAADGPPDALLPEGEFAGDDDDAQLPAGDSTGEPGVQLAAELTQGVLDRMGYATSCAARTIEPAEDHDAAVIWVDIAGKDASRLLAHQCEPLEALQLIVQMMWAHQAKSSTRITLDADHYKAQREKRLAQMAQRLAERVVSTGRPITLEPMPPAERRLVHLALRDHPDVVTESQGEGSGRRVTIKLKK